MMKRWISALLVLCSLNMGLYAQTPSRAGKSADAPILSSANP